MKTSILFSLVAALTNALTNYNDTACVPNAHWVDQLPYFNPAEIQPCSYAGTLNSNADGSHQMFYWMYPAEDEANKPITLWLNGGPGASSTFANFLMNGPMRINQTGTGPDDYIVYLADASWVEATTMIYIDQPVGTGFSYGEPLLTTMTEAADEFVYFLTQLFTMYPDFVGKDLYFAGESYAGKYVPAYSYAMLMYNQQQGSTYFNLLASMMGDPYTVPVTMRSHMHLVSESLNIIDDTNMPQIAALIQRCREILTDENYSDDFKGDVCASPITYINHVSGYVSGYDNREFSVDWDANEDQTINYFTISGQVQTIYQRVHVQDSTKTPVFEMGSSAVGVAFAGDQLIAYSQTVTDLVSMGLPLLIYAGEWDTRDGPKTVEPWLRSLYFDGNQNFWDQSRQTYYVQVPNEGQIVGGYWRESQYLSYLTIPKAGHFVPANNYWPSYQFMVDYINNGKLMCHEANGGDCSVVDTRCAYMDDCSGHGTCTTNGVCECDSGYKSADCSLRYNNLTADGSGIFLRFSQYGPNYFAFTWDGGNDSNVTLQATK